jgi:hypothetical protein
VLEWPNVHATIAAHHETLNGALVGMKAGIGCDQSATWLEGVCHRPQHAAREIVVQMVKNADGDGDIGRGERVVDKLPTSSQMNSPRPPCTRLACSM